MNAMLPKWIVASVAKYLEPVAAACGIGYYVDGVHERGDLMRESHAEIRITGPFTKTLDGMVDRHDVIVNVLITAQMHMLENSYDMFEWAGKFQEAMLSTIPIKKYGDGDELLGCLKPRDRKADSISIFHFGQVKGTDRLRQTEIDGTFEIWVQR